MLGDQKNFDLKQTVIRDAKENKENQEKKIVKMIQSMDCKIEEPMMKTNRSVLGLRTMNHNFV